jgi:hypothetical protein
MKCQAFVPNEASTFPKPNNAAPVATTVRGERCLVQAVASGAPMHIRETPRVPIRSIEAGVL